MAFNYQPQQFQMPGAFPDGDGDRDKYGYTEDDYVQMMDEYAVSIVDAHETISTPHEEQRTHRPGANNDVPEARGRNAATAQQDSRTTRPERSSHVGSSLSREGDAGFYSYNHPQQRISPNPFATFGDMFPTPPVGWNNDLDDHSQDVYHDSRSSAFGDYGGAYRNIQYAQHDALNLPGTGSRGNHFGTQALPHSWTQNKHSRTAILTPESSQQSAQFGAPRLYRASTQSPYTKDAPTPNAYSQPQRSPHPHKQVLQAQPSQGEPTVPAPGEVPEDREDPSQGHVKEDTHKGLTRVNTNGELEWFAKAGSKGVLAMRHDDIRPQLIAIAEAERVALGVQYAHPDEAGPGEYNVTSFYPKHVHWGPKRKDRPEILFAWEEDMESNPRPKFPGYMYWEQLGKKYIVLNPHDNPVKDWDIPLTIASNCPGYKLEAMRRANMSLGHKDFWARMPSRINIGTERQPIWQELGKPNAIVNMPMERFRFHAGLCSWTERKKTSTIKAGLKKLYGDKLKDNTIRAFGRDLTRKEIAEIKKGDNAEFPIEGDIVSTSPESSKKRKITSTFEPLKTNGNDRGAKSQPQKRKRPIKEYENSSTEEEDLPRTRSRKRARQGRREDSITAEVDDLVMFEQLPGIINQEDATRRYPLRSTRGKLDIPKRVEQTDEVSDQDSTDADYEERPTPRFGLRTTRKDAKAHRKSKRVERSSRGTSAEEEGVYVPTWIVGGQETHGESDEADSASQESSMKNDDHDEEEEEEEERFPFRRIPGAADVGGKCKGPSWTSSTSEINQSNEERDYRKAVVPIYIDGRVHYATYEGLISNGPDPRVGGADTLPRRRDTEIADTAIEQNESESPLAHHFELAMKVPFLEQKNVEEEDTPLQAHRKRTREFLGEEESDAEARPLKRPRKEEQSFPNPKKATDPLINQPQVNRSRKVTSVPQTRASELRKQKIDAEWAQVFEQTILDVGTQSVNYREVPPKNDEEVQSLIDAILPTREVYFAWTGEPAPRTDPQQGYGAQFDTILEAFHDWWQTHRSSEDLPIPSGVIHLGRSVDDWISPSKDSIYYEAFEKGYRAQRGGSADCWEPRAEDALRGLY